jgi:CDP-glycerol glycerophosphotransferase (TagB/SpsB family)
MFIEWITRGRDFEIDLPLIYFFEKILKWEVSYVSIFNLPKILSIQPDIVIMSNTTGADINVQMARLIEKSGILLFSHVSEGMFREKDIEEFVWGWGKEEKYFSEELSMLWSKKSYDMAIKAFPNTKQTYRVSGAVGFDKYKLFNFNNLDTKGYKKVIGYAGFDFHNIYNKKNDFISQWGENKFYNFMQLANKINNILESLIISNPDILFLCKPHPGDGDKIPMEVIDLDKYENVTIVNEKVSIVDVISNSDIWLNYNSSTNLEAWLLNKPTISFNIDQSTYSSDILYGSIISDNPDEIKTYIAEFYHNGTIKLFEEKTKIRKKFISEYIGFDDGLNHVRFMSFLKPYIDKIENEEIKRGKWNVSFKDKIKGYIKYIVYSIANGRYWLPLFNKWAYYYEIFNHTEVENAKKLYYIYMDNYYKQNQEKINIIYNSAIKENK